MTRLALLLATLAVAGCATSPRGEAGLGQGARVGIVNLVRPQLSHYHVGPTAVANFDRKYAAGVDIPALVVDELRWDLRHRRFVLLNLAPPPDLRALGTDVLKPLKTAVDDTAVAAVQRLAREHRLDHVLVVSEVCGPVPQPRAGEMCGYGLFTDGSAAGAPRAAAYFNVAVLRLTPQGELLRPITTVRSPDAARDLQAELHPADVERVTADEIGRIAPVVRELAVRRLVDSAALVK